MIFNGNTGVVLLMLKIIEQGFHYLSALEDSTEIWWAAFH